MLAAAARLLSVALPIGAGVFGLADVFVDRASRAWRRTGPARSATHARRLELGDDGAIDPLAFAFVPVSRLVDDDLVLCVQGDIVPLACEVVDGHAWTEIGAVSRGCHAPAGAIVTAGYVVVRARSRSMSAGTSMSNAASPNGTAVTSAARRRSQPPAPASPASDDRSSA